MKLLVVDDSDVDRKLIVRYLTQAARIIGGLYELSQVEHAQVNKFQSMLVEELVDDAVLSN